MKAFVEEAVLDGDHTRIVWKKPYSFVMRPGLVPSATGAGKKAPKKQKPAPDGPESADQEAGVMGYPILLPR